MVLKRLQLFFRREHDDSQVDHLAMLTVRGRQMPVRGLIALLGAILLLLCNSVDYSYGNLNTYVISYFRAQDPSITYADWIYISQTKVLLGGIAGPFAGELARRLGLRVALLIGVVLIGGGYMLTTFSVDVDVWCVALTMGVTHGFSYALVYAPAIGGVLKWFPGKQGRFGSIVVAAYGFGSVIWNPLETAFVNPENKEPLDEVGEDVYFDDPDVLARVPDLFILLGSIFLVMGVIGVILLRNPTKGEAEYLLRIEAEKAKLLSDKEAESGSVKGDLPNDRDTEIYNVKPKNMLKTLEFYLFWALFFCLTCILTFMNSYQKAYGLIYIKDDAFFANVAILQNIINGCTRIMGGFLYDWQGFKVTAFCSCSLASVICFSFLDLSLIDNETGAKALYGILTCSLFLVIPCTYAGFPPSINQTFGPKYFSTAYGMVFTSCIGYSLLLVLMTQVLFDYVHYSGLFMISGCIGILGMIAAYIFPENRRSNDFISRFETEEEEEKPVQTE